MKSKWLHIAIAAVGFCAYLTLSAFTYWEPSLFSLKCITEPRLDTYFIFLSRHHFSSAFSLLQFAQGR